VWARDNFKCRYCSRSPAEDGFIDQDYSLNPGRYVGVMIEDDGMTEEKFRAEMRSLNAELTTLNTEVQYLERTIAENLQSLVGGDRLN